MSMNFTQFCHDFAIPYWTSGKNVSPGWVNVNCVYCQDPSNHLGFSQDRAVFYCWRCGKHNRTETISRLAGVPSDQAKRLMQKYNVPGTPQTQQQSKEETRVEECGIPHNLYSLTEPNLTLESQNQVHHKAQKFISQRGYSPMYLEYIWGVKCTLNHGDWPFRLFVPYYYNGTINTFQMRDFTQKSYIPYDTCPKCNAIRDVKQILYGFDLALKYKSVIVVEGVMDAWRLGEGAVATSGSSWKLSQAKLLAENWEQVHILFDQESEAQNHAEELAQTVESLGTDAYTIDLGTEFSGYDPDDLSDNTAEEIREELLV